MTLEELLSSFPAELSPDPAERELALCRMESAAEAFCADPAGNAWAVPFADVVAAAARLMVLQAGQDDTAAFVALVGAISALRAVIILGRDLPGPPN